MTTLSVGERTALALIPKFSSVFSLFGSIWIIIEVLTEKTKRGVPYHRLLLAMSIYDVLESSSSFFSTWPIPVGSPYVIWASGNDASCTAQGFLLQLTLAVPLYNAMLSLYYVLVIRYNYTDRRLRSFVEPAMHIFCFSWSFGTAVYSAAAHLINNADLWCWIASYPHDCIVSWDWGDNPEPNPNPCQRADNAWIYRFGFYFVPLWISIAVATYCTWSVYRYVYVQDEKTLRYRRPQRKISMWNKVKSFRRSKGDGPNKTLVGGRRPNKVEESHPTTNMANETETPNDGATSTETKNVEEKPTTPPKEPAHRSESVGLNSVPEDKEMSEEIEGAGRSSVESQLRPGLLIDNTPHSLSQSMREFSSGRDPTGAWSLSMSMKSNQSVSTVDSADVSAIQDELARRKAKVQRESAQRQAEWEASNHASESEGNGDGDRPVVDYPKPTLKERYQEWKEKREQYARDMPHTVEVFHQALFYLGTFYCTHAWSTTNRLTQAISGQSWYPILVLHAFFDPFQGFLNFWVYQRPRFVQTKKKYPDLTFFQICKIIFRFTYMGEYVPPHKTNAERAGA